MINVRPGTFNLLPTMKAHLYEVTLWTLSTRGRVHSSMGILTLVSSSMVVQRVKIQWGWSHLLWIHDACPCTVNQRMRLLHKFKRSRTTLLRVG